MFKLLKIVEARKTISELEDKLNSYNESLIRMDTEFAESKEINVELRGTVAEKELEIYTLQDELEVANEKIKNLEVNSLDASAAAAEIVASVGAENPVEAETQADKSNEELMEEFNTLTDPAKKVDFYRKHRNKLINKE